MPLKHTDHHGALLRMFNSHLGDVAQPRVNAMLCIKITYLLLQIEGKRMFVVLHKRTSVRDTTLTGSALFGFVW